MNEDTAALVHEHTPKLLRFASLQVGDRAEDAVQETWVRYLSLDTHIPHV